MNDNFLIMLANLDFKVATKNLLCMHPYDIYDFLCDVDEDPFDKIGYMTRDGLFHYAMSYIKCHGPHALLDWLEDYQ